MADAPVAVIVASSLSALPQRLSADICKRTTYCAEAQGTGKTQGLSAIGRLQPEPGTEPKQKIQQTTKSSR